MNKVIRDWFIEAKIYLTRSISYVTIINAGMILFLTLSDLKTKGIISWDVSKYFIPIFIISFIGALIVGYMDVNIIKGFSQENKRSLENNPAWTDLVNKVDSIYNEIHK
jgi:hypothetical protein